MRCGGNQQIDGKDCEECNGYGTATLTECPRKMVGPKITEAINVAGMCTSGVLPVAGGLMDQSAWFLSLWSLLQSEEAKIEADKSERSRRE